MRSHVRSFPVDEEDVNSGLSDDQMTHVTQLERERDRKVRGEHGVVRLDQQLHRALTLRAIYMPVHNRVKGKCHCASLFGAGLKLVRAKFHDISWLGAGSELVRNRFGVDSELVRS